jgi:hypothetical protein
MDHNYFDSYEIEKDQVLSYPGANCRIRGIHKASPVFYHKDGPTKATYIGESLHQNSGFVLAVFVFDH